MITLHQKFRRGKTSRIENPSKAKIIFGRMFSLKAFHGALMFVSWINIAGRVFVTPLDRQFDCYTYPVFKQISSSHYNYTVGMEKSFLPAVNPNYDRVPWAYKEESWALMLLFGPLGAAIVVRKLD